MAELIAMFVSFVKTAQAVESLQPEGQRLKLAVTAAAVGILEPSRRNSTLRESGFGRDRSRVHAGRWILDGTSQEVEGTTITVVVPAAERAEWLAAYDPASASSPAAATGRIIARAVLDELRRVTGA